MITAIYPGSFDPVTYGHIDIAQRALSVADKLIIAVLNNSEKTPLFSVEERVKMLQDTVGEMNPAVEIEAFSGLSRICPSEKRAPDHSRTARRHGLRARTADGTDQLQAVSRSRDDLLDGQHQICFLKLQCRQGDRCLRRRYISFCPAAGGTKTAGEVINKGKESWYEQPHRTNHRRDRRVHRQL